MKKNDVIIIQARLSSKRIENKMLQMLDKFTVVEWVIKRLVKINCTKIICLPFKDIGSKLDTIIQKYSSNFLIDFGDQENVYERVLNILLKNNIDMESNLIRICADRPFIEPILIEHLSNEFNNKNELLFNHISYKKNKIPRGFGAEIFSYKLFKNLYSKNISDYQKEHMTSLIWENELIRKEFTLPKKYTFKKFINRKLNYDIDTEEDIYKIKKLIKNYSIAYNDSFLNEKAL